MTIWENFKERVITLILGKWRDSFDTANATVSIIEGMQIIFGHAFAVPMVAGVVCVIAGIIQWFFLTRDARKARSFISLAYVVIWGALFSFVWQSDHNALSIPYYIVGLVWSFFSFVVQGTGGRKGA